MSRHKAIAKPVTTIPLSELKPHPRNYRTHPDDQITHIQESLRQHGFYRNIVVAKDNTILAGHGVVEAARKLGLKEVPAIRLDLDPGEPGALKVLTADNELGKFAEVDDRLLTEILREVRNDDLSGLLGTGYNDAMLAGLVMVTRPASEIETLSQAAEWVGMPEYEDGDNKIQLIITFKSEDDRKRFDKEYKLTIDKKVGTTWSTRWPFTEHEDVAGLRFQTTK